MRQSIVAVSLYFPLLSWAYPQFLYDPQYKGVADWKRAALEIANVRAVPPAATMTSTTSTLQRLPAAPTTPTRGSQSNPTDPCFNVYAIAAPTNNPGGQGPDGQYGFGYQAPQTNDVRSPCPALNTLANHGYLPRDGRGINGTTLVNAFLNAWGIDESVIAIPKTNALSVCTFQSGGSEDGQGPEVCEEFDLNVLNTPHVFEHDHSFSRKDYNQNDQNGPSNNHLFNPTVFNESLAVLNNSCYMTISQANEVRLQREVQQFQLDKTGWFTLAPSTQETEVGFIFAVMSEQNQPGGSGNAAVASVRVDWWQYWFMYESFPTPLGWQIPNPPVENTFVQSISSSVIGASITSTPSPFFTEFISGPTGTFPSTTTPGTQFFNPTLGNLYTNRLQIQNKRLVIEATPTP